MSRPKKKLVMIKCCKYQPDKECYSRIMDCSRCGRNPYRFDNRKITKGQIILLKRLGVSEEEISRMDFKTAYKKIESLIK